MSTSTIGQYFSNRVEELISEFTGHTLIFFKGFGLEQIRFLITHPNSLLDDASLFERTGTGTVRHHHGADENCRGRNRGIEAYPPNGMGAALQ